MRVLSGFAFSVCPHYFCCSITLPIGLASRFRMRQVNVVGTSPFSLSSRVIQTLQAPPDVAPTSITVRTASETSLRLRWVVSVGAARGAGGGCRGGSLEFPQCACETGAESCLSHGFVLVKTNLIINPETIAFYHWCWISEQPRLSC